MRRLTPGRAFLAHSPNRHSGSSINLSRSFGDKMFHPYVSATPDLFTYDVRCVRGRGYTGKRHLAAGRGHTGKRHLDAGPGAGTLGSGT